MAVAHLWDRKPSPTHNVDSYLPLPPFLRPTLRYRSIVSLFDKQEKEFEALEWQKLYMARHSAC